MHGQSRVLEIAFSDGATFRIPFELMRIYSPSAEVQGHGPGQEVLQTGKREVDWSALEPVGNYAVQPAFSDGHDTGIFSWDYLYFLGSQQDELWADYTQRLRRRRRRPRRAHARQGRPRLRQPLSCAAIDRIAAVHRAADFHNPDNLRTCGVVALMPFPL